MIPRRMEPTVVILCGGKGTRLQEHAPDVPKPLVEIGGRPIVWHVIRLYAGHGFRRFLLLTGHRSLDELTEDCVLERGPLERLAARGELRAFRHGGFWDCMDTHKDVVLLNELWASGRAPWKVWA